MKLATDLLAYGLANHPQKPAVIEGTRILTFQEVSQRANRLVEHLRSSGRVAGDRIALLAKNEIEYLEIQVACLRGGFTLVPLNFRLAKPELQYILEDCSPSILITSEEYCRIANEFFEPVLSLGDSYESLVADVDKVFVSDIEPHTDCTILYTSGTTGRPKGAVLTNRAMYARISANVFEYEIRPADVFLQALPLFHIASNVTYTYAYSGATNVFLKEFHPLAVLDLIQKHEVSTALLVPTMINALIHQPEVRDATFSSLGKIAYGASPIPPTLLEEAITVFGCDFLQLYGMTETSAATVLRPEHHDPLNAPELLSSAGQASLGMEVRIVDDADHELAFGDVGEIVCRGDAVMRGYWRNESASADALKGGWMHTGDMGYRNHDGFYFVTDRKKDMIVSGGENIYPREVEDVLFSHPDILEAAVIGIPDEHWGERVHAVLVLEAGKELGFEDLTTYLRAQLASYKMPKSMEVVSDLPKNATGKVLKTELRASIMPR